MRAAIRNEFKEGTRGSGASPSRGGHCPFVFSDDVATGSSSVVALMVKHRSVSRHSLQADEADEQRYRVYAPLSIAAAS